MSEFLLWFAAVFVTLWVVSWALNVLPLRVAKNIDAVLEKTSSYLPASMWPLEHTLLSLLLGGLTILIATFPQWEPWASIVEPATEGTLQPGVLLGLAAALLALLLFAANQVQNLERETGSENLYLDENVGTYLARRSRVVKMLALPVFHVAVMALFIVPLIWSWLPTSAETLSLGAILPSYEWSPRVAAIAFWCASFGIVSGVLLLNVLNTLRNSTLGFRAPGGIERRIEDNLSDRSNQFYRKLFTGSKARADNIHWWITTHVGRASKLPKTEQLTYLKKTIGAEGYWTYQKQAATKCAKLTESTPRPSGTTKLGDKAHSWLTQWRTTRAKNLLEKRSSIARKRTRAILTSLRDIDLGEIERAWLIEQCLAEVESYDENSSTFFDKGFSYPNNLRSTPRASFSDKAHGILTRPADEIEQLDRSGNPLRYRSENSPSVEIVPIFTFRTLAAFILPNTSERGRSTTTSKMLHQIVDAAASLRHGPSQEIALRDVVEAVIDRVIINRSDDETLPLNILAVRERFGWNGSYLKHSNRQRRDITIENQAMAALTANTELQADARSALLDLLPQRLRATALLHLLVYKSQTMRSLTSSELSPFFEALRKFRWGDCDDRQEVLTAALEYFQHSYLRDYVTPASVSWVFQALEKPLTLELCVEFLKANIAGLTLMHFIQWRVLAGEVFYGDFNGKFPTEPTVQASLMSLKSDLQQFATDWQTVDPSTAEKLEVLLLRFPPA